MPKDTEEVKIQEGQIEGEIRWHYTSSPTKYEVKGQVSLFFTVRQNKFVLVVGNIEYGLKIKQLKLYAK